MGAGNYEILARHVCAESRLCDAAKALTLGGLELQACSLSSETGFLFMPLHTLGLKGWWLEHKDGFMIVWNGET